MIFYLYENAYQCSDKRLLFYAFLLEWTRLFLHTIKGYLMSEQTFITGKDAALEDSISTFQHKLKTLGFNIEEASWLNPVPNVWSVHIRDADCPQCFSNS